MTSAGPEPLNEQKRQTFYAEAASQKTTENYKFKHSKLMKHVHFLSGI